MTAAHINRTTLTTEFSKDLEQFREMTEKFYRKEVSIPEYKRFSGAFGSYAQRGGGSSMLRLRLTGGEITQDILEFLANSIETYGIDLIHLTTCQSLQLHNLNEAQVCTLICQAFDHGIITRGGGGNYPRNVMASPLSGVQPGEPFDVLPYAKEAADYILGFIKTVTLPRKLKICFSNSPSDEVHAFFRDLGFVAREDHTFDVYMAGGLGRSPRMGLKAASGVAPREVLYHIHAMLNTFITYGNYENRGRARTRFLQEDLGPEALLAAYQEKLEEAFASQDLMLSPADSLGGSHCSAGQKAGDGALSHPRVISQKQPGLYAVCYKPAGGNVPAERFRQLFNAMTHMEQIRLRIAPTHCIYIINCTAAEAQEFIALTPDSARTQFEQSMACIGSHICQVGARDSQATLSACKDAVLPMKFPEGTLPILRFSGCPSSCCAHQIAALGFRGGVCQTPEGPKPAYAVYEGGCALPGQTEFGQELGVMPEKNIPDFLVELGRVIAAEQTTYERWITEHREYFLEILRKYFSI